MIHSAGNRCGHSVGTIELKLRYTGIQQQQLESNQSEQSKPSEQSKAKTAEQSKQARRGKQDRRPSTKQPGNITPSGSEQQQQQQGRVGRKGKQSRKNYFMYISRVKSQQIVRTSMYNAVFDVLTRIHTHATTRGRVMRENNFGSVYE